MAANLPNGQHRSKADIIRQEREQDDQWVREKFLPVAIPAGISLGILVFGWMAWGFLAGTGFVILSWILFFLVRMVQWRFNKAASKASEVKATIVQAPPEPLNQPAPGWAPPIMSTGSRASTREDRGGALGMKAVAAVIVLVLLALAYLYDRQSELGVAQKQPTAELKAKEPARVAEPASVEKPTVAPPPEPSPQEQFEAATRHSARKEPEPAFALFSRAAESGHVPALREKGRMLFHGSGVAKDQAQAFKAFEQAAGSGDMEAMHGMATCLMEGAGTSKDEKRAVECFRKAAEKGYEPSQWDLACCYVQGWGVPVDMAKARTLLEPLAEKGYAKAQEMLGAITQAEHPYLLVVEDWLQDQKDGGRGISYWDREFQAGATSLIAVERWKLLDYSKTGEKFANVKLRVWSSNRGGQPIVADWNVALRPTSAGWRIWMVSNLNR